MTGFLGKSLVSEIYSLGAAKICGKYFVVCHAPRDSCSTTKRSESAAKLSRQSGLDWDSNQEQLNTKKSALVGGQTLLREWVTAVQQGARGQSQTRFDLKGCCVYFQCIITASVWSEIQSPMITKTSEKFHFFKVVFVLLLLFFIHIAEEDYLMRGYKKCKKKCPKKCSKKPTSSCSSQRAVLFSSFSSISPMGGNSPFCWLLFRAWGLWGEKNLRPLKRLNLGQLQCTAVCQISQSPEWLPRVGMSLPISSSAAPCASPVKHWPVVGNKLTTKTKRKRW